MVLSMKFTGPAEIHLLHQKQMILVYILDGSNMVLYLWSDWNMNLEPNYDKMIKEQKLIQRPEVVLECFAKAQRWGYSIVGGFDDWNPALLSLSS